MHTNERHDFSFHETKRRFEQWLTAQPEGREFTILEAVAEIYPELDEAEARDAAAGIAEDLQRFEQERRKEQ